MNSLTRRRFLRDASTATAAAMLPPFFLQASSKSGSRFPIVGSGVHTYECVHDWLVPPDGLVWGDTHGLAQDAQGHIYVAHTVNKSSMRGEAVVVYDASGRFLRAFGEEFRGGAHGLGVRREKGEEVLYHCDINQCKITKTTLKGDFGFDALSPHGRTLYLIQHVSAEDLFQYRVRAYDLQTGKLLSRVVADKRQEDWNMNGFPVARATTADGRWVYTLYSNPNNYPFVHALDTMHKTAVCIGLPWNWTGASQQEINNSELQVKGGMLAIGSRFLLDRSTFKVTKR